MALQTKHPGYRIYILGAGFSVPAGLPTAQELFVEVRRRIEDQFGIETKFQRDIEQFVEFAEACENRDVDPADIDLERFLGFLDIEHFLGLRGSDTWSDEGNESQVLIKRYIGKVLAERTPPADRLPQIYYDFAENLSTTDTIITFNYDNLLERSLDHVGKPYRLFPDRYSKVGEWMNEVDSSKDEVVILKMHGSVDWFSRAGYDRLVDGFRKRGDFSTQPKHEIFSNQDLYTPRPIVDGPRNTEDPLLALHRAQNIERFYAARYPSETPFLISPSPMKVVYSTPFLGFWHGMGRAGGWNLGVSIIGFSLPEHDNYARVAIYQIVSNYQYSWWDEKLLDSKKDYVRLVDFRQDAEKEDYFDRYRFVDKDRRQVYLDGFESGAVDFLFRSPRE